VPIDEVDVPHHTDAGVQVVTARAADVGGLVVRRVLPRRARRTVGPWCFADRFGPADVAEAALRVGPHPHIGLQTVTWLLAGEAVHTDSLGVEQSIRPGQLNLMSAGRGVAHAEQTPSRTTGTMHGIQLWVAQPDATRHGPPAFEHLDTLPEVGVPGAVARVLVGRLGGSESPARADWPSVAADVTLDGRADLPLDPAFEHAVLPGVGNVGVGNVGVDGTLVAEGALGYLAPGRDAVRLEATAGARLLLLGGAPFEAPLLMWWNFVARRPDELAEARADWDAGAERFGTVHSPLARIPPPPPTWAGR
jgi:quercetin 2,3-dioxygenase